MRTVTRRNGNIITFGNSLYLNVRPEIEDLGLDAGDTVAITLKESDGGNKIIVIEKADKQK